MKLMDFTSLPIRKKSYGGANGNKISVVINDELYILTDQQVFKGLTIDIELKVFSHRLKDIFDDKLNDRKETVGYYFVLRRINEDL